MVNVNEVFGVTKNIKTYVERDEVDGLFKQALKTDKQILVYGASKQGKTALVSKYCGYDEHIVFQLTPQTELIDIYQYVLRQAGVAVRTEYTEGKGTKSSLKARAKIVASFAIFGRGDVGLSTSSETDRNRKETYEEIPFNIAQPQEIAVLLKKVNCRKVVILENFHYLSYENQQAFSFDLRAFQELGVRFIILGVWRERNRMLQFNGDLLDRVQEIPVEPWREEDFFRIVQSGEELLNIKFEESLVAECCRASFSSVGVFQDLLLGICINAEVREKQKSQLVINNREHLEKIICDKTISYGDRHKRSLEAIASGSENNTLNLPYSIIVHLLLESCNGIEKGLSSVSIYEGIKRRRGPRGNHLRQRYVAKALQSLSELQAKKGIRPPILAYDENSRLLHVTDSTLYFYLKNADLVSFVAELREQFGSKRKGPVGRS
jgi:hypothetical protein